MAKSSLWSEMGVTRASGWLDVKVIRDGHWVDERSLEMVIWEIVGCMPAWAAMVLVIRVVLFERSLNFS